jgi:hypothetical protein
MDRFVLAWQSHIEAGRRQAVIQADEYRAERDAFVFFRHCRPAVRVPIDDIYTIESQPRSHR